MTTYTKQCHCNAPAQTGRIIVEPQIMKNEFIIAAALVYHPEPTCVMCDAPWLPTNTAAPQPVPLQSFSIPYKQSAAMTEKYFRGSNPTMADYPPDPQP